MKLTKTIIQSEKFTLELTSEEAIALGNLLNVAAVADALNKVCPESKLGQAYTFQTLELIFQAKLLG
jgi:hypothetical protein